MSVKTFFEKVGSEIEKLFKSGGWETKALATIGYVAPLVETLVTLFAGTAAGGVATSVINQVKASLATVSTIAQDGTPAPGSSAAQTVATNLTSINTNLAALLADADVKNSSKVTEVEATSTLISGEISALLSGLTAK